MHYSIDELEKQKLRLVCGNITIIIFGKKIKLIILEEPGVVESYLLT